MGTHTESPLVAKIRKLMAKANDPSVTEAEASAFAAKVQQMLLENGLALGDIKSASPDEQREQVGEEQHSFKRWNSPHRRGLLDAVCAYYMCSVLYWRKTGILKIIGKPQNVAVAASMTDYLIETVVRMSTRYGRENPGSNIIDFRRGAMLRLRERLDAARRAMKEEANRAKSNTGNLPVLFVNESALVAEYTKNKYKVRTVKARPIKHGSDARAGRAAAEGISLHPQVGGSKGGGLQLGRR